MGKQPVAWREYYEEYYLIVHQESMEMCTGRRDITALLLKKALNTIQQYNHKPPDCVKKKNFIIMCHALA